ncbi:MAG: alpha/beta fold hydrolase [Candidatus Eremiobacteraeota bacterium]|nr:alpha/beta fold hydrolase [Candidatus Eremiobacteraeota bacterium]
MRRILRPLGALAGVTGAAAVLNRGLRARTAIPVNHLGGTQRAWKWRGFELFATEAGSGPPVLLVHGVSPGTSSFEYRKLFARLAERHRVVAFDFLGCGLSAMPNVDYTAELFVDQIVDALNTFDDERLMVVGTEMATLFVLQAATRAPQRVKAIVAIAPREGEVGSPNAPPMARQAIGALLRLPLAGETLYNAMCSNMVIRRSLRSRNQDGDAENVPQLVAHYYAVSHQPGARYVPAAWLSGALRCDVARDLPFVEAPLLVLFGDDPRAVDSATRALEFVRLAKRGIALGIHDAGRSPHEEQPEAVLQRIEEFYDAGTRSIATH